MIIAGSTSNSSATIIILPAPNGTALTSDPDPAKVKAAIDELKGLSVKEKRMRIKEAKKEMKAFSIAKKAGKEPSTNTLLLVILAILLPPLAVYLHEGVINNKFWISLILTLIFWLPGVIYALIVILGNGG
jgi:uncharacterized membrane protein YqaE (UPF0057 family)